MTVNDAFKKAAKGNDGKGRRITVYDDYENRHVLTSGMWYEDHILNYRADHGNDPVELIGESLNTVTVACKAVGA